MRQRRSDCSEAEAIAQGKEHAEIYSSLLLICAHVDLKPIVDDSCDVVCLAGFCEQVRGEDGEGLGIVEVEAPVTEGDGNVHEQGIADENVGDGEEGADEGTAEERGDSSPIEGEGADAKALKAGADLLGGDGVGEDPANPGDVGDGGEEVTRDGVPGEAADEHDDEELGPRHAALILFMQSPKHV